MWDEREELDLEIADAEAELAEALREQEHLNQRQALMRAKNAPKQWIMRYKLEAMDQERKINGLHERIHMLKNLRS